MPSSTSEPPEGFDPSPREEWKLIFQGAEAKVWQLSGNDGKAQWICKERFSKAYRHPVLDERLTKTRCRSEARILEKCGKTTDIRVPRVVRVDPPNLYLEFIEGQSLKDYWLKPNLQDGQHQIGTLVVAGKMGTVIGLLHNLGVIHGDLTTSNMMIQFTGSDYELVMIDFGLAKSTSSVEEQAVDLYVLERALQSSHPDLPENFFEVLLESYTTTTASSKKSQNTLQRLEQVRLRGRKRECFG
jgi:TP53 regulating kinase-like protein